MNRRGFISLLAGAAGAVAVPWRGLIDRVIVLPPVGSTMALIDAACNPDYYGASSGYDYYLLRWYDDTMSYALPTAVQAALPGDDHSWGAMRPKFITSWIGRQGFSDV